MPGGVPEEALSNHLPDSAGARGFTFSSLGVLLFAPFILAALMRTFKIIVLKSFAFPGFILFRSFHPIVARCHYS